MAFQLSPGVLVVEKDLTNIIPAVATSIGGFVGEFAWGPVLQPVTISSELDLIKRFGKPSDTNFTSFFSAANFLSYSNNLKLVRVVGDLAKNASAGAATVLVNNEVQWEAEYADGSVAVDTGAFIAKFPGTLGNSLKVSMVDAKGFTRTLTGEITAATNTTAVVGEEDVAKFLTEVAPGDILKNSAGQVIGKVASVTDDENLVLTANAAVAVTGATGVVAEWEYAREFDGTPGTSDYVANLGGSNDEMHIIVIDEDGVISGTPGTILEKFAFVSKASDAKRPQGGSNYYVNVLRGSQYIFWMTHPAEVGTGADIGDEALNAAFNDLDAADKTASLAGGVSDEADAGDILLGYDLFKNAELIDVNLLFTGHHPLSTAKYVIENVAQARMDCIVFCSPSLDAVVNNPGDEAADIVAERVSQDFNVNSSYGVMDSGWKYQYDKYNDVYRWIPLNADVAGLCARTDTTNDPWWSPGGLTRGQIKNVVKLAFNPNKTERDELYKRGINPVVSFPGEGTVLFGDKTLLTKPSAFDRINVRRLFIVLEKAIATAARYQLFEFNDAFTRAQFRNLVEPFLRDVQGRRGIFDFRVVCDDTNNTGEVIDRNEFIADIYIKPARSINFITLNFIATRTDVAFEEIVGA